jgi:hypothetical protein
MAVEIGRSVDWLTLHSEPNRQFSNAEDGKRNALRSSIKRWTRMIDWAVIAGLSLMIVAALVRAAELLPSAASVLR